VTADGFTVDSDKDTKLPVLANDEAGVVPFDKATLQIVEGPDHAASYKVHDDHIHYRSTKGYIGPDILSYSICTTSECVTTTVAISVV
jgi:hypothetical protein